MSVTINLKSVTGRSCPPPSSMSDEELLLFIDNEYPNLTGALRMLADRFLLEERAMLEQEAAAVLEDAIEDLPKHIACPECGSQIALKWEVPIKSSKE